MPPSAPRFALPESGFALGLAAAAMLLFLLASRTPTPTPHPQPLFITEIGAADEASVPDEDGDRSDWIEIANLGAQPASLDGWHLTDTFRKLDRWTFPPVSLGPGERLIVFASGKDRRTAGQPLHAGFQLLDQGEYLALVRPDGKSVAHEYLPKYPRQHGRVTFGLREGLDLDHPSAAIPSGAYAWFTQPTPGQPNRGEVAGRVADLKTGVPSAHCTEPVRLALFTQTAGARIVYTTDGTLPTPTNGRVYRQPLHIATTTILRAAAFLPGFAPSRVLHRTLLFPDHVAAQTGAGFPTFWGYTNGEPVTAHYRVDPRVTGHHLYRDAFTHGLQALPTLSLIADPADLFDPTHGIYANPMESGYAWERPASAEWIDPTGQPGFHVQCGLRIQGGWNRRPEECPKHSFRLLFKREYGSPKLEFPLFGAQGVRTFDTLILRGGCNNTWLHWSGEERRRGDYLRDQWMRATAAAMGQPAARGRFVHLYLNGLYWGLYNLTERPDPSFLTALTGAPPAEHDSRNGNKILSGDALAWDQLFLLANSGITNNGAWRAVTALLDVTQFADYMILNYYGANADWDRASNWYAARTRSPAGPYRFFVWDGERTLEDPEANTLAFDDDQSPSRLFHRLMTAPQFRAILADRLRLHCTGTGALTPGPAADRFRRLAESLQTAVVAESARWGNYRVDVHPYKTGPYERYTRDDHWTPEIQRLLNDYFPKRTDSFLRSLAAIGIRLDTPSAAPAPTPAEAP